MELTQLSLSELQKALRSGQTSAPDVLRAYAARIEKEDASLDGYLSYDLDRALAAAESVDVNLPLGGIPIAIKDAINVQDEPCTCASKILQGYTSPYDATVIANLRAAGAIPFGRTNMDEFAMGSSTENSAFKVTRNPWDADRVPGGSSGGSAAVVAAELAVAALGSDTGGSIRQPAAFCGCVGLKPSYGRVSRYGLVAFASSLDQIGPMTRTVEDSARILNAIAGRDPHDSTSLDEAVPDFTHLLGQDIRGMKIGLPKEYFIPGIDPAVESAVRDAIKQLTSLGAEIVEISLPHTKYAVSVYYIIATAEASANLARFDGVRYGQRAASPENLLDHYEKTRGQGFGAEVKRRIILGTYVLSSGYYDAYYLRAQKVRSLIRQDFAKAFESVDAIVCPTTPKCAPRIGEHKEDLLQMYLSDVFTIATNLAGICGISVPCGFVDADNGKKLPVGLQLLANSFEEPRLLQLAHAYEQSTPWHKERPPRA